MESLNLKLNVQDAIDIMFEPTFTDEQMMSGFQIIKNLYAGEYKIGLLSAMKNVTGKQQACSPKYKGKATMSERSLFANYVEAGAVMCWEEFLNTHYDYLAPFFTTQSNANPQQLISLLTKLLGDAIKRDVQRTIWYGDASSTDDNLNWATGMFKYLDDLITTNEIGYRINSNQGVALTGQQAYELLQAVVKNANINLKNMPASEKTIHINGLLWDNILQYLEENAITNGFIKVFEQADAGAIGSFRGIKVKAHYEWDDISQEYFGLIDQNKIVYTHDANMVIGTDLRANAIGGASYFKSYQDPKTDEIFLSSKFVFAVNYVWPELFSVAL